MPTVSARAASTGRVPKSIGIEALATELEVLTQLDSTALRARWRQLYRRHPPKKLSRDLLALAVAWKLQERAMGGLSAMTKRQLAEVAQTLDGKSDLAKARKVSLKPGARIVRPWGGETHEVVVLEAGFLWRDKAWNSLSVIAREITGTRWSGPRFFRIGGPERPGPARAAGETARA